MISTVEKTREMTKTTEQQPKKIQLFVAFFLSRIFDKP